MVTRSKVGKNIIILVANLKDDQNHFSSSVDVKSKVFFYISCNSDLLVVVIYVFKVSDWGADSLKRVGIVSFILGALIVYSIWRAEEDQVGPSSVATQGVVQTGVSEPWRGDAD